MPFRWLTLFPDFPAEFPDFPADAFDAGPAFWREVAGSAGGCHPDPHVDPAGPLDQVTGHVDVACAGRELLAARHVASGARIVPASRHRTTMAGRTGRRYCLTGRDPRTGRLPASAG